MKIGKIYRWQFNATQRHCLSKRDKIQIGSSIIRWAKKDLSVLTDEHNNDLQGIYDMVEQKKLAKSRLFKAEPLPICKMENDCMNDMARC